MQDTDINKEDDESTVDQDGGASQTPTEIELLRDRAKMLGIKFHPMTGVEKLKLKIEAKLGEGTQGLPVETAKPIPGQVVPLTHDQFKRERSNQIRKSINRLIRVRVTCMNPNKTEWEGEIISIGSAKLGTYKKYVPFNSVDGWHIPHIMFEAMKERKYTQFFNSKGPRGEKIRKGKLMPEFAIEILPPLTAAEIKDLAQRQQMRESA